MKYEYDLPGLEALAKAFCFCPGASLFFRSMALGIGGSSKSSSTTNSDNSTKVTTTNQQVGASEGSFAVGANSNVTYESVDTDVVQAAVGGNTDVAKTAITATADVAKTVNRDALDFGESALDNVRRTTESANALLSRSYETYAGALKDNSGDAATTVVQDSQKNILYAVGILAVAVLGYAVISRPTAK